MDIQRIAKVLDNGNDQIVRETVLDKAQKEKQIIYGARAINRQVSVPQRSKTKDYDILTKRPSKSAKELVSELNRKLGREEFKVEPALHKGTFKVKDSKGETIVDYTQLDKMPKTKKSWGNSYYDIDSIKQNIKKRLKGNKAEFRKEKDTDALNRINISQENFNF
jgi:hypothetical protein